MPLQYRVQVDDAIAYGHDHIQQDSQTVSKASPNKHKMLVNNIHMKKESSVQQEEQLESMSIDSCSSGGKEASNDSLSPTSRQPAQAYASTFL